MGDDGLTEVEKLKKRIAQLERELSNASAEHLQMLDYVHQLEDMIEQEIKREPSSALAKDAVKLNRFRAKI